MTQRILTSFVVMSLSFFAFSANAFIQVGGILAYGATQHHLDDFGVSTAPYSKNTRLGTNPRIQLIVRNDISDFVPNLELTSNNVQSKSSYNNDDARLQNKQLGLDLFWTLPVPVVDVQLGYSLRQIEFGASKVSSGQTFRALSQISNQNIKETMHAPFLSVEFDVPLVPVYARYRFRGGIDSDNQMNTHNVEVGFMVSAAIVSFGPVLGYEESVLKLKELKGEKLTEKGAYVGFRVLAGF